MLKEWNQTCCNRCYLLWRNVHKVNLIRINNREVSILTALYIATDERTVIIQRSVALTYDMVFLLLCGEINHILVLQVNHTILNLSVWSLNESKLVNLCINTE